MKPSEAMEICPHVELSRHPDKGVVCRHRLDVALDLEEKSDLCHHAQHFRCELVLYQIRKQAKENRGPQPALSVSRVQKLAKCPRQYALTYVHRVQGKSQTAFVLGDAFGVARAKMDQGVPWDGSVRPDMNPVDRARVRAALRFYQAHPPYPLGTKDCEIEVSFEIDGVHWIGYLDALDKDRTTITEWKYAALPYDFLAIVQQASVYFMGVPEARSFERIRFKKPQMKPRKNEKWSAFEDRVYEKLMSDGDSVYDRIVLERSSYDPERVVRSMMNQYKLVPELEKYDYPPSFSNDCAWCGFKPACQAHTSKNTTLIANLIYGKEVPM